MAAVLLAVLSAISLVGLPVFMLVALRGIRRASLERLCPASSGPHPPVSILKPCCGVDEQLAMCLESHFAQTYPDFEIVFGVSDERDPALAVIRRAIELHPERPARVVLCGPPTLPSPKLSNLARMLPHARHPWIWITDSNIEVDPGTLADLVAGARSADTGCVGSALVGVNEETFGAALENVHLTAFAGAGTFVAHAITGLVGTGKSVLLHRDVLAEVGGFEDLGRYAGDDLLLFQRVRASGRRVALGAHAVRNVSQRTSLRSTLSRHARWTRIRWCTVPFWTALEPLLSPLIPTTAWACVQPTRLAFAAWLAAAVEQVLCDLVALDRVRGRRLSVRHGPVLLARPYVNLALWAYAAFVGRAEWRGKQFVIARGSVIQPNLPTPPHDSGLSASLRTVGHPRS